MLHLVMEEAVRRGQKVAVLFIDLEGQYKLTIAHVARCLDLYADHIEEYWIALPLNLRNAVSVYEPQWMCWEPGREKDWVRQPPSRAITDEGRLPFFRRGMEFEEFVPGFADWYARGGSLVSFVGIRTQESLNRWRSLASDTKARFLGKSWTTAKGRHTWNAYPIYDWRTEDIWTYHARYPDLPANGLYDLMHRAGLTIHQQRICQPYGDDQRKGLWLFHVIEPETWGRVVARVNGANQGALYAQEPGNILGQQKVTKPEGHTWRSFAELLLESMPEKTAEHYRNKIALFIRWWNQRGHGGVGSGYIPDEAAPDLEASRKAPSWRRICKALLRNDYWCKGLSFVQQANNAESYARYAAMMRRRRAEWEILPPDPDMREPSEAQLLLLAALAGGSTTDHGWRAMAAALARPQRALRRTASRQDATHAINLLRGTK